MTGGVRASGNLVISQTHTRKRPWWKTARSGAGCVVASVGHNMTNAKAAKLTTGAAPARRRTKPADGLTPGADRAVDLAVHIFEGTDLACFVDGTRIGTAQGPMRVEDIEEGCLIPTLDHGLQPVRRVLSKTVSGRGTMAPIRFDKGILGNIAPLYVSPRHRVLLAGWQAQLLTGTDEVLCPAEHLVNDLSVTRQERDQVTYFHLLFDRHEIIWSEGAPTESYHPLLDDSDARDAAAKAELCRIYPELAMEDADFGPGARPQLSEIEARLFRL